MSRKEKKYHYIYKTTDTRNSNFYIGMHSTENLDDGYIGSGYRLKKLIYKHGKQIFNMEILEFLPDRKSLIKREEEIVNSDLIKEEKCMNLKPGGSGGFCNEEHRNNFLKAAKISCLVSLRNGDETRRKLWKNDPVWSINVRKKLSNSKKGKPNGWKNKNHSDKTKEKISQKNRTNHIGVKNSQYGTCWVNDGINDKKIKKEMLNNFINEGWMLGRRNNINYFNITNTYEKYWITNGIKNKLIKKDDINFYVKDNWRRGRTKSI